MTCVIAALTLLPSLLPAQAFFSLPAEGSLPLAAPFSSAASEEASAVAAAAGLAPSAFQHPLEEAYRTSLLGPDVTSILEARARSLGLPVVEIAWTHEAAVSGPTPLRDALLALAAANAPSMQRDALEPSLAEADALPRDLQVALARLVWRLLDAGDLQAEAFSRLTPEETRAIQTYQDGAQGAVLAIAIQKVDVAATLGAARAVDQAVVEATPVLRKWSLLLGAVHDLAGRPATPAAFAAGAPQMATLPGHDVLGTWALGLVDRPRTGVAFADLPEFTLPEAVSLFYVVNGVPVDAETSAAVAVLGLAEPAVAAPLARAVTATLLAQGLVLDGSDTGVDPGRLLALDREAARIAAVDGATAADLVLLEEYADLARRAADTPALAAAALLLEAAADLSAAAPAASKAAARAPVVSLPAADTSDDSRIDLPGLGIGIHNARNGTSVWIDTDGDGDPDVWPPVSSGAARISRDDSTCSFVVYQELHNNDEIEPDEILFQSGPVCNGPRNVTLQDPHGYFVVGGEGDTVYDHALGGRTVSGQAARTVAADSQRVYNTTFVGRLADQIFRPGSNNNGQICSSIFPPQCRINGVPLNVHSQVFDEVRRQDVVVNSNHYQYVSWDLGGDDRYLTNAGGTFNWSESYMMKRFALGDVTGPVALLVDERGNDTYLGTRNFTVGSAQLGVGLLVDRKGDDSYSGPAMSVVASAGIRRYAPGVYQAQCPVPNDASTGERGCGRGLVYGDTGVEYGDENNPTVWDEETPHPDASTSPGTTFVVHKAATAFAGLLDEAGNDTYRGADRSLAFANNSFAFLVDKSGDDRYESRDFSQGVANTTSVRALFFTGCSGIQLASTCGSMVPPVAVAALVDAAGNDTYVTSGRENMSQGRGIGNASFFRVLPLTVGLLLDLDGNDTGIRRNGNVSFEGLATAGFQTRGVYRGQRTADASDTCFRSGAGCPSEGVSLALDLDVTRPSNTTFRPDGRHFAVPAGHVDMREDPLFALDVYLDIPQLFVLGAEAATTYEADATVLVDLGGADRYLAPVGAATWDWNATTSHDSRARGARSDSPSGESIEWIPALPGTPHNCKNVRDERQDDCTLGTYRTGRFAPVALSLDVEGSDLYEVVLPNATPVRGFGFGAGGVGALYDLGGGDFYNVSTLGLGAGELFGTGILFDASGDDTYRMVDGKRKGVTPASFGLGFAHAGGVGVAVDAGGPHDLGEDVYTVANLALGSVLVDFSREYSVFYDANGQDIYNATARGVGHVEAVSMLVRDAPAEFDGLFDPMLTRTPDSSLDDLFCYYLVYADGDASATFVDDGLEADEYRPRAGVGVVRRDDSEWRATARPQPLGRGTPSSEHPEHCTSGIRTSEGGTATAAPPTVRGGGSALGIDNLDAYYHRHATEAMRDPDDAPAGLDPVVPGAVTPSTHLPLDEVFAVRQILLAPAAEFRNWKTRYTTETTEGTLLNDTAPVAVVATRGPTAVRSNALAFAQFLVRETLPRTTCGFVPHPTAVVTRMSTSSNEDPADGGRPPLESGGRPMSDFTNATTDATPYRAERRASAEMGYCVEGRNNLDREDPNAPASFVDDPCRVEEYEREETFDMPDEVGDTENPAGEVPVIGYEAVDERARVVLPGGFRPCRDGPDPNPVLDPLTGPVRGLDLPLAATTLPVLAEALRLVGEAYEPFAPQAQASQAFLVEALARWLAGDLPGAEGSLEEGFTVSLAAGSNQRAGNSCDPARNPGLAAGSPTAAASAFDDCQDVGRVEFYALRGGVLSELGSYDNLLPAAQAADGVRILPLAGDARRLYVLDWATSATDGRAPLWSDGPFDVLVRTYYDENGGFGSNADSRAYVRPADTAPVAEQGYRRIHDEYGFYPGENWLGVGVDNRPTLLRSASSFGHFRPGVDVTKTVRLAFSEPVSTDSTVTISRFGEAPRTFPLTEAHGAIRCPATTAAARVPLLPSVVEFPIDVSGRTAGEYTLTIRPRDCSHPDGPGTLDGRRWSQWSFEATVVGDLDPPAADLAMERDHLNAADAAPCSDVPERVCFVALDLVPDRGLDRPQSPISQWIVEGDVRATNGQVTPLPAFTSTSPVLPLFVRHGEGYALRIRAVDEAGNVQTQPTERFIVYDARAPKIATLQLPSTVRVDGTVHVAWTLDSADEQFPGDAIGVRVDWATGAIPAKGANVTRVWRPVPESMVVQGLGVASVDVVAVADLSFAVDPAMVGEGAAARSKLQNATRMHAANLTDGHQIELRFRAVDSHGNVQATNTTTGAVSKPGDPVRFDSIPPALSGAPQVAVDHDRLTVSFALTEAGTAVVEYGLAGTPLAYTVAATPVGDGVAQRAVIPNLHQATDYEFRIVARDLVGNSATFPADCPEAGDANATADVCGAFPASTDRVVTVGVTAPAAGVVASGPVKVQWSVTDHRQDPWVQYQLKLSVDGGRTFPHNLTAAGAKPLFERSHPLRSYTFDSRLFPDTAEAVVRVLANNSLNAGAPLAFDGPVFRIDNAPPRTVALLDGAGVGGWFRTPVVVTLRPADTANVSAVERVEWSRDNRTFTVVEAPVTSLTVEDEGTHTIYYRAVDALGNAEPVRSTRFSIDRTVPDVSALVEGGAPATRSATVDLEVAAKDARSGVQSVVVRAAGQDPVVVPGERFRAGAFVQPWRLSDGDGEKTIEVVVTDNAGNRNTVRAVVRLDTTAPTFEDVAFDRVAFESATATVRVDEPASLQVAYKRKGDVGFLGRIDLAEPALAHRVLVAGLAPSNEYVLRIVAEDPLGNRAERTVSTTTLEDHTPPTQPVALAARDEGFGAVAVTWAAAQDNVAVSRYIVLRATVDEGGAAAYEPVGLAHGTRYLDDRVEPGRRYSWRVVAVDAAGNEGPQSPLATGVATTRPVLEDAGVTPASGLAGETFTYAVTYRDADGDAPAFVRVYIDGEVHDMTRERGTDRYVHRTTLAPTRLSTGVHTFRFEASDGRSLVRSPVEGLDEAVGPAVFGAADETGATGVASLGATIREVPAGGLATVVVALALAAGAAFMTPAAFRRRRSP